MERGESGLDGWMSLRNERVKDARDETSRFCSSERAAADNLGAQPLGDLGEGELAPAAPFDNPRREPRLSDHLQASIFLSVRK